MNRRTLLAGIGAVAGAAMVPGKAVAGIWSAWATVPRFGMPTFSANGLRVVVRGERGPLVIGLLPKHTTWVALVDGRFWCITTHLDDWRELGARVEPYGYFTTNAHGVVGFTALYRA